MMGLRGEHEVTVRGMEEGQKRMEFVGIKRRGRLRMSTKGTVIAVGVILSEKGESTGDSGSAGVMKEETSISTSSNRLEEEVVRRR